MTQQKLDTTDHDDWLVRVRSQLTATRDAHAAQLHDLAAQTPDPAEADAHAALLAATRQSLADATEALRRLDEGRYGICESCGKRIPTERLEILPHARFCVPCQQRK